MHRFSCRLFLRHEDRFKTQSGWMTAGVKNWKNAKQKIKEHSSSESQMQSMIKWHALKRNALIAGFERANLIVCCQRTGKTEEQVTVVSFN